jgi:hypothetical protein
MMGKHNEEIERLLTVAVEHGSTAVSWAFLCLVAFISVDGGVDTIHEAALTLAQCVGGGMAVMNTVWFWQSLAASHALDKRNRS